MQRNRNFDIENRNTGYCYYFQIDYFCLFVSGCRNRRAMNMSLFGLK